MQLTTTIIIIISLAILAPFANSIISLGTLLICTAMVMTILVGQTINAWFAFILFLVYITGLLVLFSYIIAISPNTYYTQNNTTNAIVTTLALIIIIASVSNTPFPIINPTMGTKSFDSTISQLFNTNNTPIYWITGIILLIALLIAVTICYNSANPLRSYLP